MIDFWTKFQNPLVMENNRYTFVNLISQWNFEHRTNIRAFLRFFTIFFCSRISCFPFERFLLFLVIYYSGSLSKKKEFYPTADKFVLFVIKFFFSKIVKSNWKFGLKKRIYHKKKIFYHQILPNFVSNRALFGTKNIYQKSQK